MLSDDFYEKEVNEEVMHQPMKWYLTCEGSVGACANSCVLQGPGSMRLINATPALVVSAATEKYKALPEVINVQSSGAGSGKDVLSTKQLAGVVNVLSLPNILRFAFPVSPVMLTV